MKRNMMNLAKRVLAFILLDESFGIMIQSKCKYGIGGGDVKYFFHKVVSFHNFGIMQTVCCYAILPFSDVKFLIGNSLTTAKSYIQRTW